MNDGIVISNEMEYNEFLNCYRSEGFSLYMKLIDSEIAREYSIMMKGSKTPQELSSIVSKLKGLQLAKDVGFNALKENEDKYTKDRK